MKAYYRRVAEENKIRDAADAIKGVVDSVPIYQDLAQPAVQELGKGLQNGSKDGAYRFDAYFHLGLGLRSNSGIR